MEYKYLSYWSNLNKDYIILWVKIVNKERLHFVIESNSIFKREWNVGDFFSSHHLKHTIGKTNTQPITDEKEIKRLDKKRLLLGMV